MAGRPLPHRCSRLVRPLCRGRSGLAIGSLCWRDLISTSTGATVLDLDTSSPGDPMVELGYDEGGGGWWPLTTLVFATE